MCRVVIVLVTLFAFTYGFRTASVSFKTLDERIIGGENADIEDFPYQVAVQEGGLVKCGGSIISATWALTSGQCVGGSDPSVISMRAGSSIRGRGGTVHQAIKIVQHEKLIGYNYNYAAVQVAEPYPLGQPGVQAIPLADTEPTAGSIAVATGWVYKLGELTSGHLQRVYLPIMSRIECQLLCPDTNITSTLLCAGRREGGIGPSPGDAGGPLVVDGVQVGIWAYGISCAGLNRPGIYSNIADQRDWIRETTGV